MSDETPVQIPEGFLSCPSCGEHFPVEESVWLVRNKLFCSERCAYKEACRYHA